MFRVKLRMDCVCALMRASVIDRRGAVAVMSRWWCCKMLELHGRVANLVDLPTAISYDYYLIKRTTP